MRVLIIMISLVFALGPRMGHAGPEALTVKTQASAIMRQGAPDVKSTALEQAFKNAVSEALISLTGADSPLGQPETKQILSDPRAFVTNYRVLAEDWIRAPVDPSQAEPNIGAQEGDTYNIIVEASIDIERLREALAKARQGEASASLTVTILDVTDYQVFQALVAAIRKTPAVTEASYDTFQRGRITLTVSSPDGAQTLAQRLSTRVAEGFEVHTGWNKNISIKALPGAGATR